jgi:hypothetical protein
VILGVFNCQNSEKINQNCQISIFDSSRLPNNTEGCLNVISCLISYVIYSWIWLKLLMDVHHHKIDKKTTGGASTPTSPHPTLKGELKTEVVCLELSVWAQISHGIKQCGPLQSREKQVSHKRRGTPCPAITNLQLSNLTKSHMKFWCEQSFFIYHCSKKARDPNLALYRLISDERKTHLSM